MVYVLEDAEQRYAEHSTTFEIPPAIDRTSLRRDDLAQLIFMPTADDNAVPERMWVTVTYDLGDGDYEGWLSNQPVNIAGLNYGASVRFHARHIIGIIRHRKESHP